MSVADNFGDTRVVDDGVFEATGDNPLTSSNKVVPGEQLVNASMSKSTPQSDGEAVGGEGDVKIEIGSCLSIWKGNGAGGIDIAATRRSVNSAL